MKLDFKYSKSGIEFLDTKIYQSNKSNKLLTAVYQKPTNRICFLDPTSNPADPKSFINKIPLSYQRSNQESLL